MLGKTELSIAFKMQLLRTKIYRSQGFTIVDVLAATIVLSSFIAVAMTTMTAAVAMKVRARAATEATNWIEQDIEAVRNQASQISYVLAQNAAVGQPTVTFASTNGLAVGEQISFERNASSPASNDATIYVIQSINNTTKSVTLSQNLAVAQPLGKAVISLSKCSAASSTAGFANLLQQVFPTSSTIGTKLISGKPYTLSRTSTVRSIAPYEVLQLTYVVTPQGSTTPTATIFTEVIPNAAFQCPSI